MQAANNLRFLLALGNQKVVVLQDQAHTHIYSGLSGRRINVSLTSLTQAIAGK